MKLAKVALAALFVAAISSPSFAQSKTTNKTIPCSNIVQVVLGCWFFNAVLFTPIVVKSPSEQVPAHWDKLYPGATRTMSEDQGGND